MASSSSNIADDSARVEDTQFLSAANANVSNFVTVKLSGDRNYHLWKTQILCLMKTHNMGGIVDAAFVGPRASSTEIKDRYDSLLKGWIFGSVCENVLGAVYDIDSAKGVWNKLKSFYDAAITPQQGEHIVSTKSEIDKMEEGEQVNETQDKNKDKMKKELRQAILKGDWREAEVLLIKDKDLLKDAISSDGSKVLHSAVGIGGNNFVKNLISHIDEEQALVRRNDGSTALHIAAIVGNTNAAKLLVEKNSRLLQMLDYKGKEPLDEAYENMHLDTIEYLLKAIGNNGKSVVPRVDLLVNLISDKQYKSALKLINKFPEFATEKDHVLLALAKTFPCGLRYWETIIYPPSLSEIGYMMLMSALFSTGCFDWACLPCALLAICGPQPLDKYGIGGAARIGRVLRMLLWPLALIILIILIVCFPFLWVYSMLWKYAAVLFIKDIKMRKNEWDEATQVLEMVCDKIDESVSGSHHPHYYSRPILEAASQNAHKVVYEILSRSPDAIRSIDKNGYDIIQLAIVHRSEKVYNLIYDIGENTNRYRTFLDSSKNNILHLVGRLAPLHELNRRTGATLQLQRELQWREEVKKLVSPANRTQANIFKETPDMVFTKEHENLVKEGEKWMKTTAESCSITAALVTTIVFAAAITVPGGSDQVKGIPLFSKNPAFIVFAISDAISLFASSTALLVFLSILTARFAEKDFLVSLPRRLLIGLFFLFLSTTTMMVAFSSSLYLVFCHQKPWTLAPICGLAFIPIAFFAALQFPLMIDLFQSTHLQIFGKQRKSVTGRFNPDAIRGWSLGK